jgi:outer membrane protein OmpA-like peptidoglycan-associated protein
MKKFIFFLIFSNLTFSQEKIEIFFNSSSDIPDEKSTLFFNIWMKENTSVEIIKITGHCDDIDSNSYNKDLASRRIKSIKENLVVNKIYLRSNLVIENYGEDFVQSTNSSINRKVVVYYIKNTLSSKIKKAIKGDLIKLENFFFDYSSSQVLPKSYDSLNELLKVLNDYPKLKIEIQGHICCQNLYQPDITSTERAKAIYSFLIKNKIDKCRLSFKGYGVTRPIHPIPEKSIQEEDDNRRVEILIVEN